MSSAGKSETTIDRYRRRVANLTKLYKKLQLPPYSRRGLAAFVIAQKPNLMSASWRQYKAAVISVLQEDLDRLKAAAEETESQARYGTKGSGHTSIDDCMTAIDALMTTDQSGTMKSSDRTSAAKAKRLPRADRIILQQAACALPSIWGYPLRLYLGAGVLAGLRPIEWATSELTEAVCGALVLRVCNANTRSC